MNLKLVITASLFTMVPALAYAQPNNSAAKPPKPTAADVQRVVQSITSDRAKVQAYCDMGKVLAQIDQAEQKKDANAVKTLGAKADGLAQQLGPDYGKIMDGLEDVDPNSPEGKRISALFQPLYSQCK